MAYLDGLVERAVVRIGGRRANEDEASLALRFFRAVDETLNEFGAVFMPREEINLLTDALRGRKLTAEEHRKVSGSIANTRRQRAMAAIWEAGEPFHAFDCDVASVIYVAAGERLGFPVRLVEVPGHNFVRWSSPEVNLNWDANDGCVAPDDYYRRRLPGDAAENRLLGYLENRSEARVISYWLVRSAQALARRNDHTHAIEKLRLAVATAPEDLIAQGELAWELATAPETELRRGNEARAIAEKLVGLLPRRAWLETFAAACAETGDFPLAVELQTRAEALVRTSAETVPGDIAGYHQSLIKAYQERTPYAVALAKGLVRPVKR